MPFNRVRRGVFAFMRVGLGLPSMGADDGTLERVDSIDLLIVGLGLILVLLVLLRR